MPAYRRTEQPEQQTAHYIVSGHFFQLPADLRWAMRQNKMYRCAAAAGYTLGVLTPAPHALSLPDFSSAVMMGDVRRQAAHVACSRSAAFSGAAAQALQPQALQPTPVSVRS
jgi:hypothetical protein